MKTTFHFVVEYGDDSEFRAVFPNLNCVVKGDTRSAVIAATQTVLENHLIKLLESGQKLPKENTIAEEYEGRRDGDYGVVFINIGKLTKKKKIGELI